MICVLTLCVLTGCTYDATHLQQVVTYPKLTFEKLYAEIVSYLTEI